MNTKPRFCPYCGDGHLSEYQLDCDKPRLTNEHWMECPSCGALAFDAYDSVDEEGFGWWFLTKKEREAHEKIGGIVI